jgi:ankyrin repeat protein
MQNLFTRMLEGGSNFFFGTKESSESKDDKSARILQEFSLLREENVRLRSTMTEMRNDFQVFKSVPYAQLHLKRQIDKEEACNAALNAFLKQYSNDAIFANEQLTLQEIELRKELKLARESLAAAECLCKPPPTLVNVLYIIANIGHTKIIAKCMNLKKATRTCKRLQAMMREVKMGKSGLTQLNFFAWKGLPMSVSRMLLIKGIEIETKTIKGHTPLHNSAYYGRVESSKLLLDHGAMIESKTDLGSTPLLFASQEGHLPIVSLLIARGADLEARANDDFTPLNSAAFNGRVDVCKLLLDHGAKIESRNTNGGTSLFSACQEGHLRVVSLLIARGADIEASNNLGFRPLHVAAYKGRLDVIKALIARHVDVNALTKDGVTAVSEARRGNHSKVVSYFKSKGAVDEGLVDEDEDEQEVEVIEDDEEEEEKIDDNDE